MARPSSLVFSRMTTGEWLYKHFHPTIDFFRTLPASAPSVPWAIRLRLLLFQPLILLTNVITHSPYWSRSKPYSHIRIPTRSGRVRALVYYPPSASEPSSDTTNLLPLHLDIHGGAFVGGNPEGDTRFCAHLARTTNTVVISTDYRLAPIHPFPAAIDDIDDVVSWLHSHAASMLGADPTLMTVGGSSAGANLAFASCLGRGCHGTASTAIKGILTFYAAIELRLSPWQKPHPRSMPKRDPFSVFLPLYDEYARLAKRKHLEDPRMSPILIEAGRVPGDVLMVVAGIDILVHEQEVFVERLRRESREMGLEKRVEVLKIEEAFHGWMERKSATAVRMMLC